MNTKGTPDSMNNNVRSKAENISINDKDYADESLNKEGSLKYVVLAAYLVVFILVAFYAVSRGNPAKLIHPSNSKGELCGHQHQTGKPNLLYFDVTKCTGLAASDGGCATPQVCVKECPNTYWTSSQGKPTGLDQFCEDLPVGNTADMMSLVEDRLCPAYLLPSMPVLGRCAPVVGMGSQAEAAKRADKMNAMKTDDGTVLNMDTLVRGIGYVKHSIDARTQHEKLFALIYVYWWILLVSSLLAITCSLTFTVIIKIAGTTVLWINQALCLAVLVARMVFSLMMYRHMMIGRQEEISSASMSSYMFNKIFWLACGIILTVTTFSIFIFQVLYFQSIRIAIEHISEGSKSISYSKMVFLPIIKSMLNILIITCSIMVSVFLATTGSEEFRVVESCSSETCFNNASKKIFSLYDICDPTTFEDCTGCPRAQCVFHQFGPDTLASWLHVFNWAGMVWLLFLVQSCQDLKKTGSGLNIT